MPFPITAGFRRALPGSAPFRLRLPEGAEGLYLAAFVNGAGSWDYIETTLDGKTFRGFIPAGCLVLQTEGDEWNG